MAATACWRASWRSTRTGRFLGLRVGTAVGIGAYVSTFAAIFATMNTKNCLSSVYAIPAIRIGVRMVFTNAAPLGPYRGAGRPEAIYLIERLIDEAARQSGIDRIELRRRNLIPAGAMPYAAANGQIYDSGEFEAVMDQALALADWQGFPARRAAAAAAGRLRGIGLCCFLEVAGGILEETADLRFEDDGSVALRIGAQAMGQGHLSTFPPLIARRLGVPLERVRLIEGDSDEVPEGIPSVASRSIMMCGSAAVLACDEAIGKGRRLAEHILEAAADDLEFEDGRFRVRGTDRTIGILEVAARARAGDLPADLAGGLDCGREVHLAADELPERLPRLRGGDRSRDRGGPGGRLRRGRRRRQHPARDHRRGQIHGGVAQGLGQVLGEQVLYDEAGPAAHRLVHGLPDAARDRPAGARARRITACLARTTRSAPRVPASPASPARCPRR